MSSYLQMASYVRGTRRGTANQPTRLADTSASYATWPEALVAVTNLPDVARDNFCKRLTAKINAFLSECKNLSDNSGIYALLNDLIINMRKLVGELDGDATKFDSHVIVKAVDGLAQIVILYSNKSCPPAHRLEAINKKRKVPIKPYHEQLGITVAAKDANALAEVALLKKDPNKPGTYYVINDRLTKALSALRENSILFTAGANFSNDDFEECLGIIAALEGHPENQFAVFFILYRSLSKSQTTYQRLQEEAIDKMIEFFAVNSKRLDPFRSELIIPFINKNLEDYAGILKLFQNIIKFEECPVTDGSVSTDEIKKLLKDHLIDLKQNQNRIYVELKENKPLAYTYMRNFIYHRLTSSLGEATKQEVLNFGSGLLDNNMSPAEPVSELGEPNSQPSDIVPAATVVTDVSDGRTRGLQQKGPEADPAELEAYIEIKKKLDNVASSGLVPSEKLLVSILKDFAAYIREYNTDVGLGEPLVKILDNWSTEHPASANNGFCGQIALEDIQTLLNNRGLTTKHPKLVGKLETIFQTSPSSQM